jgi:type IV pilus assembly protein PilA
MLLQNIRAKIGARLNGDREAGFTLIELLVVMLILGILAAIALPAFFNQKSKAGDAKAKEYAHTAQVAMETYATDNSGSYVGATKAELEKIEPTISSATFNPAVPTVSSNSYKIGIQGSATTQVFYVERTSTGALKFECIATGTGGCPTNGKWGE